MRRILVFVLMSGFMLLPGDGWSQGYRGGCTECGGYDKPSQPRGGYDSDDDGADIYESRAERRERLREEAQQRRWRIEDEQREIERRERREEQEWRRKEQERQAKLLEERIKADAEKAAREEKARRERIAREEQERQRKRDEWVDRNRQDVANDPTHPANWRFPATRPQIERGRTRLRRQQSIARSCYDMVGIFVDIRERKNLPCLGANFGELEKEVMACLSADNIEDYPSTSRHAKKAMAAYTSIVGSCGSQLQGVNQPVEMCRQAATLTIIDWIQTKPSFCKVVGKGGEDSIPLLWNESGKDVMCRVCGEKNGQLVECEDWRFGVNESIGGWATPFVWCGIDQIVTSCFEYKGFSQSCFGS